MSEQRPLRICDVCGQVDDHPRHVFVTSGVPVNQSHIEAVLADASIADGLKGRLVAEIADTTNQQRHMDCCRQAGCPDGSCVLIGESGGAGLTGAKLLPHLTSKAVAAIGSTLNEKG